MAAYAVKQEATLHTSILNILKSEKEISDIDLEKQLKRKYQHKTQASQRLDIITKSSEIVNLIEIRTTSDGKVVFAVKDELTLKADQAGLSDTEMEVFKLIKNAGSYGSKATWLKEKLQIGSQKIITGCLRNLMSIGLIAEDKVGKAKIYRRPDVELDESITGGYWQDEDTLKLDQEAIEGARSIAANCLSEKINEKLRMINSGEHKTSIPFGEAAGCSVKEVTEYIVKKEIFPKPPKEKDILQILETLRLDDIVNCVESSKHGRVYYLQKNMFPKNMGYASTPCSSCPVKNVCHEDSSTNPEKCEYLDHWLGE